MMLLTNENTPYSMVDLPDHAEETVQYTILDYTDPKNVDFYTVPLIFLETFSSPAADLRIGNFRIQMPLDWHMVIGEPDLGDVEVIEIRNISARDFSVLAFNPFSSYMMNFFHVEIENIFPDFKWFFPQLKYGHLLVVPLENKPKPTCAFFVKDAHRIPEVLEISKFL